MSVTMTTVMISLIIVFFGYGALLDFVDAPFALLFSGVIALVISTLITYTTSRIILKAYKETKRK
jgi:hypothetical protein